MFNKEIFEPLMKDLIAKFRSIDWTDAGIYKQYLAQSYYYTSYSTRMLAAAAGASDRNSKGYYLRSLTHISEEQGHDAMAVADLKNLGGKIANYPELGITRALWQPQFYMISKNPEQLLGYILALEKFAVGCFREFHEIVLEAHGEKSSLFVKVHADDDPDHVDKAFEEIERCDAKSQEMIFANYEQTCQVFGLWLEELAKSSSKAIRKVA